MTIVVTLYDKDMKPFQEVALTEDGELPFRIHVPMVANLAVGYEPLTDELTLKERVFQYESGLIYKEV